MRKTTLLAVSLLAFSPLAAQAAILELSFDAIVSDADDPENLHGYSALLGQQARVSIQIDLDALPELTSYDDGIMKFTAAYSESGGWLSVHARIGDQLLSSNDFHRPADYSGLDILDYYGEEAQSASLLGGIDSVTSEQEWDYAGFDIGASPSFPEALSQLIATAPFTFLLGSWGGLAYFQHGHGACGDGSAYITCSDDYFLGTKIASITMSGEADTLVTGRLLETPVPAAAWLFGSALLGLGARRASQARG